MAPPHAISNPVLAGRIQGFGNVNPPPLEEDNASTITKRVVNNLGSMLGEEVMLTVDDFREKGAVGAVKDAVADAGDLLIDGVTGIFGWIRGDPPPEEEEDSESAQRATQVLAQGPRGAAYGVSQASPTGGINAVWVMPEEADPATLAELAAQSRAAPSTPAGIQPYSPQAPMTIPGGPTIQPYVPPGMSIPGGPSIQPYMPQSMTVPGGSAIQPYVPCGKGQQPAPFVPGALRGTHPGFPGSSVPGGSAGGIPGSATGGVRGLVEQVTKGETIVGPQVAKRLLGQCASAKLSAKQVAELICESARRLYLGLDGGCQGDMDAALLRLLSLVDALAQQEAQLAEAAVRAVVVGISEELLSLQSSRQHRAAAEPMLQRVGLVKKNAMPEAIDLLGGEPTEAPVAGPAQTVDLLGGSSQAAATAAPVAAAGPVDLL